MKATEAIFKYLKQTRYARKIVDRLVMWNPNDTIRNNMKSLDIKEISTAYSFVKHWDLRYKKLPAGRPLKPLWKGGHNAVRRA